MNNNNKNNVNLVLRAVLDLGAITLLFMPLQYIDRPLIYDQTKNLILWILLLNLLIFLQKRLHFHGKINLPPQVIKHVIGYVCYVFSRYFNLFFIARWNRSFRKNAILTVSCFKFIEKKIHIMFVQLHLKAIYAEWCHVVNFQ